MKLLNASQIKELDRRTVDVQEITSADLMRRASRVFFAEMMDHIKGHFDNVIILAGSGNNGGDGAAVANLCLPYFNSVSLILCNIGPRSEDLRIMIDALDENIRVAEINEGDNVNFQMHGKLLIDALFGSGLNREIKGYWGDLVHKVNNSGAYICSIDLPSGLFTDILNKSDTIIHADWTLSFEMPKLSFFYPENERFLGKWSYASIGLERSVHSNMDSDHYFIDEELVNEIFIRRKHYSHKGTYGHAALITGSYGMAGASVLSARGCIRSGVGKLSCYIPEIVLEIMQSQVPEAICTGNNGYQCIESIHLSYDHQAIGIGCGIDKNILTREALRSFLTKYCDQPMILDADALNIIGEENWLHLIPKGSLITPHPGEFRRLFGDFKNYEHALKLQKDKAKEYQIFILLKGFNSRIATPDGKLYFNKTGNPGMATAGSGDVLTGILTGLAAQGYSIENAAVLGTYLHGLSGDLAAAESGQYGLIASDLINFLPKAFNTIEHMTNFHG